MKITLEGEQPISLNKFYAGQHWQKRREAAQTQQLLVKSQIDPNSEPFDEPVKITFRIFYGDRRLRDIDNATVKMYIDGLKPHIIKDDDWRYVKAVEKIYEYDEDRPRVEIYIRPYSPSLQIVTSDVIDRRGWAEGTVMTYDRSVK